MDPCFVLWTEEENWVHRSEFSSAAESGLPCSVSIAQKVFFVARLERVQTNEATCLSRKNWSCLAPTESRLFCFGFLDVIYFSLKSGAMRANIT